MNRIHAFSVLVGVLVTSTLSRIADDQQLASRDIIRKAIDARGGKESLAKYSNYRARAKGALFDDHKKRSATLVYLHRSYPASNKVIFDAKDPSIKYTYVFTKEKAWRNFNGVTVEGSGSDLRKISIDHYKTTICNLIFPLLEDRKYTLTSLPVSKINSKDAVGVSVSSSDYPDIHLYFDKQTSLLIKIAYRVKDKSGGESSYVEFREKYKKQKGGVLFHTKTILLRNGAKHSEMELVDIDPLSEVNDSDFSKP